MAYIGDIEQNQKKKNEMLGVLVGCFVAGNSGGGIIAVLMNDFGLFSPLWVGAIIIAISCIITHAYMIEPGDGRLDIGDKLTVVEDEDDIPRPDTIHKKTMYNIVGGALLDNIGSTGLFPLCLSPLALQTYYGDFVERDEQPIMSITTYQWLSVCVALLVSRALMPFLMLCQWQQLCTHTIYIH